MREYDFSQVDCLLYEPVHNVRRLLRDALAHMRLNRIRLLAQVEELLAAVESGPADLLIADGGDPDSEIFGLIHRLRHGQWGGNPFLGIVVTAFNPTQQLLSRAANSGADTLLVKPLSARVIQDRITGLIEEKRQFVVTSDFVGPDRRKAARGGATPLIEVPNSLQIKAKGLGGQIDLAREIERASAAVNERKLERQVFQVTFLFEFARPAFAAGQPDPMALEHIGRIPAIVDDLCGRLPAADGASPLSTLATLARQLGEEAQRIRLASLAGMHPPGIEAACSRALDLLAMVFSTHKRDAILEEVLEAVATYRGRIDRFRNARTAALPPGDSA